MLEFVNGNQQLEQAVRLASVPGTSEKERKALFQKIENAIYLKAPAGMEIHRRSDWGEFRERMVWRWTFIGSPEKQAQCARWMKDKMRRGFSMNTPGVFAKPTYTPAPRTGKE